MVSSTKNDLAARSEVIEGDAKRAAPTRDEITEHSANLRGFVIIGWQAKLPQRTLEGFNALRKERGLHPREAWWISTIHKTKEEAECAGYGAYEGKLERYDKAVVDVVYPPNEVRPVFALRSHDDRH